jgi:uncharacterized repeat protein (TIGR01451 family)
VLRNKQAQAIAALASLCAGAFGLSQTPSLSKEYMRLGGRVVAIESSIPPIAVLSISKTHSGNFTTGQQNAAYTVTVSNASGAAPSSGTVTVTDNVPSGLTLVSMSGSGWTCPGTASNNCT